MARSISQKSRFSIFNPSSINLGRVAKGLTIYLIFLFVVLLYSIVFKHQFAVFSVVVFLGPLGLILSGLYSAAKYFTENHKSKELAAKIDYSANFLLQDEPDFIKFDASLGNESELVLTGTVIPFLAAVVRLLHFAKILILLNNEKPATKIWLDKPEMTEIKSIGNALKSIASALRYRDKVAAYENLGEIYITAITKRYAVGGTSDSAGQNGGEDFVKDCLNMSDFLRAREFEAAKQVRTTMVKRLINQPRNGADVSILHWQALIIFWCSVHFSAMGAKQKRISNGLPAIVGQRIWIGPSKLLASQITNIIDSYRAGDFFAISRQISDSFDIKALVFRNLLDYIVEFDMPFDPYK